MFAIPLIPKTDSYHKVFYHEEFDQPLAATFQLACLSHLSKKHSKKCEDVRTFEALFISKFLSSLKETAGTYKPYFKLVCLESEIVQIMCRCKLYLHKCGNRCEF